MMVQQHAPCLLLLYFARPTACTASQHALYFRLPTQFLPGLPFPLTHPLMFFPVFPLALLVAAGVPHHQQCLTRNAW